MASGVFFALAENFAWQIDQILELYGMFLFHLCHIFFISQMLSDFLRDN